MKTRLRFFATVLIFFLAAPAAVRAQAPGVITSQGRITNSGANFTGTGQFRFVIYRTGPITTHWSHDSSSANGSMPVTAVSLPVTNGLIAVGLGDTRKLRHRLVQARRGAFSGGFVKGR